MPSSNQKTVRSFGDLGQIVGDIKNRCLSEAPSDTQNQGEVSNVQSEPAHITDTTSSSGDNVVTMERPQVQVEQETSQQPEQDAPEVEVRNFDRGTRPPTHKQNDKPEKGKNETSFSSPYGQATIELTEADRRILAEHYKQYAKLVNRREQAMFVNQCVQTVLGVVTIAATGLAIYKGLKAVAEDR